MSNIDKLASELKSLITESDSRKPRPYDADAEVLRVEGDTLWVHIAGGVDETPVKRTINAMPGDKVKVHIAEGRAWVSGNETAPPTDDRVAFNALASAKEVDKKLITTEKLITAELEAEKAKIGDLEADTAKIHELTADQLHASVAYIDDLTAGHIEADDIIADHAVIDDLDANYAHITNGTIDNAKIGYADVTDLHAHYAKINAANIDAAAIQEAWIDKLLVQTRLIAHKGVAFELDAIQVNASKIKTGTLDVERLIVSVPDSQDPTIIRKYMVHVDPSTGQPSYEKVDADILEDLTITADKIVAGTITVDKITTQNLQGTSGWINLHEGKFFYGDGANFASATNAISWNGSKLQIKADDFILSSGKSIFDEIDAIETWFYPTAPTTSNEPAKNWTTEKLKDMHLRDIYFDTNSGKSYRWALTSATGVTPKTYAWVEIEDKELAAIAERVSTNETNISQNSQQIALKANASEVYNKNKVYTKTETNSAITQKANEIDLSVTQKISEIEIGGRNLLLDTDTPSLTKVAASNNRYWSDLSTGYTATFETMSGLPISGGKYVARLSVTENTNIAHNLTWYSGAGVGLVRGQQYTMSVWCKKVTGSNIQIRFLYGVNSYLGQFVNLIEDNNWHRYSWTFTANSGDNYYYANTSNTRIYIGGTKSSAANEVLLCGFKLEKGNKATDWTPAPEDMESLVTEAKAEIKVTTDGISTEVSKKVGKTEVISSINQSAEQIKIQADKVNIEGATIFSSGRLSEDYIKNITVYDGDNLLKGTRNPQIGSGVPPLFAVVSGGDGVGSIETITGSPLSEYNRSFRITGNTSGNRDFTQQVSDFSEVGIDGSWIFSSYVRALSGTVNALIRVWSTAGNFSKTISVGTTWTRISVPIKMTSAPSGYAKMQFGITGAGGIEYLAPNLSRASVETSQRIYYRSNSNSKPAAPTAWVATSDSKVYNQWTTKVPPLAASTASGQTKYLYLWTCEQRKAYDGTFLGTTAVQLDDTTTVIDGGKIITGSILANAVKADSGQFNSALIPNLSANKITTGTLDASKVTISNLTVGMMPSGMATDIEVTNAKEAAISTAASDATTKANNAKSQAISAAATDATNKANAAEANGKKEATNYIYADSSGIKIASANPSTQNQRMELTSSALTLYDSGNNQRLKLDNTNGVIIGKPNSGRTQIKDDGVYLYANNVKRSQITSAGLNIFDTDGSTYVAQFGSTATIGKSNAAHTLITDNGLDIYKGSENVEGSLVASFGETVTIGNESKIYIGDGAVEIRHKNGNGLCSIEVDDYNNTEIYITDYSTENSTRIFPNAIYLDDVFPVATIYGEFSSTGKNLVLKPYGSVEKIYAHHKTNGECGIGTESAWVGTGSAGYNHGVFSRQANKWIIHLNADSFAVIPQAGTKTGTSGNPMYVDSNGVLRRNTSSSRRYKRDISALSDEDLNPNLLYDIDVKQFIYKDDYLDKDDQRYGKTIPGFIVEELKDIYPIAVTYEDEQPENWDARYLIPPMLKLIQNQKNEINELSEKIDTLERRA